MDGGKGDRPVGVDPASAPGDGLVPVCISARQVPRGQGFDSATKNGDDLQERYKPVSHVKRGQGVRLWPSGAEAFQRLDVRTPSPLSDAPVCPAKPNEGCGDCTRCGRSAGMGERGEIAALSWASRKRFRQELMAVPWGELFTKRDHGRRVGWLTLTFGGEAPDTPGAKAQLRAFCERFKRAYPTACLVWRLEYQDRGAPHFHILAVWSGPGRGPRDFLLWAVQAWGEIAGTPPQAVDFAWARSWRELAGYLTDTTKYRQSVPPKGDRPGRFWGFVGAAWERIKRAAVEIVGRPLWARARRLCSKLVDVSRKAKLQRIQARYDRQGKGKRVKWRRWHGRAGSAFVQDALRFLSAVVIGAIEGGGA